MWELENPVQCRHCPWRTDSCLSKINGYSSVQHSNLVKTIAKPGCIESLEAFNVMACHESSEDSKRECIGWLYNQIRVGNNIAARLRMMSCKNHADIRVFGSQFQSFEETFRSDLQN